ncbi:hypothetical protein PSHT_02550 [Puccinia striiformis]|uniref:F-box domain-containing protein n=1 Tax=Puccinia striiformis TaxID=27350 RepID=A0A2S4WHP7_9BASI|nr:hypothetical protein H4Q26_009619 [Puccinia striiformis f. sp. tritici PST-130]POW21293.1 hypothetical protein PSHT_02550 [Puccinia striiformis]
MLSPPQSRKNFLSNLPTEIKLLIIEYLVAITENTNTYKCRRFLKLAMVDRSFYKLCSPSNWKVRSPVSFYTSSSSRLTCAPIDQCPQRRLYLHARRPLDLLINQILPRQASHVRTLRVGLNNEVQEITRKIGSVNVQGENTLYDELGKGQLCSILDVCTDLTEVIVDLDNYSPQFMEYDNQRAGRYARYSKYHLHAIPTSLHPIAQLCSLTSFCLENFTLDYSWKEEYLVELIKNMVHLVRIRIYRLVPSFPLCDYCQCPDSIQPFISPLAVHLASLSSLKFIDLSSLICFDLGWSKLKWEGALEGISLQKDGDDERDNMVTIRALHAFCSLFKDSLVSLSLQNVPDRLIEDRSLIRLATSELKYVFCLPRLQKLSIYTIHYSTELLYLFRGSHNIKRINTLANQLFGRHDVASLVKRNVWIGLKSLLVHLFVDTTRFRTFEFAGFIDDGSIAGEEVEYDPHDPDELSWFGGMLDIPVHWSRGESGDQIERLDSARNGEQDGIEI